MSTLTVSEAAARLNVSRQAVLRRIQRRSLAAEKVNGVWRVPADALQDDTPADNRWQPADNLRAQLDAATERAHAAEKRLERALDTIDALTEQVNRLTVLLANEQARRLKALPRPLSWVARLLGRRDV